MSTSRERMRRYRERKRQGQLVLQVTVPEALPQVLVYLRHLHPSVEDSPEAIKLALDEFLGRVATVELE